MSACLSNYFQAHNYGKSQHLLSHQDEDQTKHQSNDKPQQSIPFFLRPPAFVRKTTSKSPPMIALRTVLTLLVDKQALSAISFTELQVIALTTTIHRLSQYKVFGSIKNLGGYCTTIINILIENYTKLTFRRGNRSMASMR